MARHVFFSFHYERDIRRVVQIRNSWVVRGKKESQPFLDKAEWESIRRGGKRSVENWIDKQLNGTSVTVVLIGAKTASRDFVKYEIKRSFEENKGLLGIYLNNVKDPHHGRDVKGPNPFAEFCFQNNGRRTYLSEVVPTYDWVTDDGYNNLSAWIERAASKAGR